MPFGRLSYYRLYTIAWQFAMPFIFHTYLSHPINVCAKFDDDTRHGGDFSYGHTNTQKENLTCFAGGIKYCMSSSFMTLCFLVNLIFNIFRAVFSVNSASKHFAYGLHFIAICCSQLATGLPISFRVTLLALGQSYYCGSASGLIMKK